MSFGPGEGHGSERRGGGLDAVSNVNESVRTIVQCSRRINTMALNAMLAARRLDGSAGGFQVVTAQVRRFSRDLEHRMQSLRRDIADLVSAAARAARDRRSRALLAMADRRAGGGLQTLVGAPAPHADGYALRVRTHLRHSGALVNVGLGVAGLAAMEAQRVGRAGVHLAAIAADITNQIHRIDAEARRAKYDLADIDR